jgi:hypothetical protein
MACRLVLATCSLILLGACASPEPARVGHPQAVHHSPQKASPPCQRDHISDSRGTSDGRCTVKTAWWQSAGDALEGAAVASKFRLP